MKHFLPRLLNKLKLLDKVNLIEPVTINNKRFNVPIIRRIGYENLFLSEKWMIDLFKKLLRKKEGTFFDVGVNIGQTLLMLKSVSANVHYVGFEPNPTCVFYARALMRTNMFANCEIFPVGLSNRNDLVELNLYAEGETDSSASIIHKFRTGQKALRQLWIPISHFNTVKSKLHINSISIIKIDVEGAELEVIKSFEATLVQYRPIILCEILPVYDEGNTFRKVRQEEIEEILAGLNYGKFRIRKTKTGSLASVEQIGEIGIHSDLKMCDYCFFPAELSESMLD